MLTLIAASALLQQGLQNHMLTSRSLSHLWSLGFGNVSQEALIRFRIKHEKTFNLSGSGGLLATVLLANSPQLLLSFLYFSYNGIITCMIMGHEWSSYAQKRRPLRVTSPTEEQRCTYYLQLPYRYGIPLLVASGTLHWLVSQAIFLARVDVIDSEGQPTSDSISTCGYSPIALIFVIALGTILVLIGITCGFLKSKGNMPLAGSCSAAISAACHPPESDVDAPLKPVMWGTITDSLGLEDGETGIGHCSFTSLPVEAPIIGKEYAGIRHR